MSKRPALGPLSQVLVPVTDLDRPVRDPDGNNVGLMREAPKGLKRG